MKIYKTLLFLFNLLLTFNIINSEMCSELVGKSGKIILYPECDLNSFLILNVDYVRELDKNNKKIAKHRIGKNVTFYCSTFINFGPSQGLQIRNFVFFFLFFS